MELFEKVYNRSGRAERTRELSKVLIIVVVEFKCLYTLFSSTSFSHLPVVYISMHGGNYCSSLHVVYYFSRLHSVCYGMIANLGMINGCLL